ncbi:MAG: hypothetical protein AVDCRST_MAG07-1584 [uncultured Frankineae bacterium]|uniref:Uncharacterized protein n=1 Tax=uncultured Frankineae bacterium TaxID=437475 RepID=A0A6J4KXJ7_9ACTN|nr:MAG: hypothetical protein AVDCRST_MAG07-1584 [uncultured Frankineae bacterium]
MGTQPTVGQPERCRLTRPPQLRVVRRWCDPAGWPTEVAGP